LANKEQLNLFGQLDDNRLHEEKQQQQSIVPSFSLKRIPVGYEKGTVVQVGKGVSYEFGSMVRDNSVKAWLTVLKIYTDNNFARLEEFKEKPITRDLFSEQFIGNFDIQEVKHLLYGKNVKNSRVIDALERISDIKLHVTSNGSKIGFMRFITSAIILEDRRTLQVSFSAPLLYSMARNMKAFNFKKMLTLDGSALRLFLAMNDSKKPLKNGKYGYTSKDHTELCKTLNIDPDGANTKGNLLKDFKKVGIDFTYDRFSNKWDYRAKK